MVIIFNFRQGCRNRVNIKTSRLSKSRHQTRRISRPRLWPASPPPSPQSLTPRTLPPPSTTRRRPPLTPPLLAEERRRRNRKRIMCTALANRRIQFPRYSLPYHNITLFIYIYKKRLVMELWKHLFFNLFLLQSCI